MYLAGMLITAWLGILSTRANVSFARMRRKYIEDNEEQERKSGEQMAVKYISA